MIPYAEVIGDPIAHSKSPIIHNFWLTKLGIEAEYRRRHVRPHELGNYFAQRRRDSDWRGCNVTIPHKQTTLTMLDTVDPAGASVGAVNTVSRARDGALVGGNTDVAGFLEPLTGLDRIGSYAIVIGAGGAARAVVVALSGLGYDLAIANRDRDRARELADRIVGAPSSSVATPSLEQLRDLYLGPRRYQPQHLALIVNAGALGMTGYPPLDVNLNDVPDSVIIYDLVYSPLKTPLLKQARARGLRTIDGLAMLVGQAAVAFELFFGQPAPRAHDAELRALLTA